MTFFYDLNKKLSDLAAKQTLNEAMSHQAKTTMKHVDASNASSAVKSAVRKASADIKPGVRGYSDRAAALTAAGVPDERGPKTDEGNAFSKAVVTAKKDGIQPGEKIRVGGKEMPLKEKMSAAKQQSFAALAPPRDKITFADKIAGAKKEVDEMLGDVAAEAMKAALGKGKKVVADEAEDLNPFTNWKKPRAEKPKVGSVERGALHDIEHTATGRKVTRRVDPNTGHSVGADDDTPAAGEKRGKGRPKGTGKSIGAKGPSGKSKLMKREGADDIEDQGEYDQEGDMALDDINTIESAANELQSIIDANENLPEWVQSKINKAMDYLDTARDYMSAQEDDGVKELDEKAVSKKQQKFMGMVHAAQKGKKPASKEVAKVAKSMGKKDAEDFAATKHKGLPEKKAKKKEVEETTVSGSVATGGGVAKDTGAPKAKKSGGAMVFGKGVYESAIAESFNKQLNNVLNEGMSINMSVGEDGTKTLSVNATDEDAMQLAQLLKMAGLGGGDEACSTCGESACGCDHIDETLANSPSPEYSNTDTMVNTLSGGLNGRKSTGQSTIPVLNQDPARTVGMHEHAEKRLWELYNRYDRS